MALKHIIKLTTQEAALKCYITADAGGSVDISLQNDLTTATEVYNPTTSRVYIKAMYWGLKNNKQMDVTRITVPPNSVHGHYYLTGSGSYVYEGFVDNVYAEKDIRITMDGPGHMLILLSKQGWNSKIETAEFSTYDNETIVGN